MSQECNPEVTFIISGMQESVGMSPLSPKWAPTLGLAFESIKEFGGVSFPIFSHGISSFLFSIKFINSKLNV